MRRSNRRRSGLIWLGLFIFLSGLFLMLYPTLWGGGG